MDGLLYHLLKKYSLGNWIWFWHSVKTDGLKTLASSDIYSLERKSDNRAVSAVQNESWDLYRRWPLENNNLVLHHIGAVSVITGAAGLIYCAPTIQFPAMVSRGCNGPRGPQRVGRGPWLGDIPSRTCNPVEVWTERAWDGVQLYWGANGARI